MIRTWSFIVLFFKKVATKMPFEDGNDNFPISIELKGYDSTLPYPALT